MRTEAGKFEEVPGPKSPIVELYEDMPDSERAEVDRLFDELSEQRRADKRAAENAEALKNAFEADRPGVTTRVRGGTGDLTREELDAIFAEAVRRVSKRGYRDPLGADEWDHERAA